MTSKIHNGTLFSALILFASCCTQKTTPRPDTLDIVDFPTAYVPLPAKDFKFILPEVPKLEVCHSPRKDITEDFTSRDKSLIAVKDPKLFNENNTEIIDLSLIPANEYAFPLPNGNVISPYKGKRRHHSGVDIKTFANDTIVSAFDGIVRMAKPFAAYGNVIVVRHYNGLETVYSHNSKNLVKPGDRVLAGQAIALTGRTGRATTEHLHFETRINGVHFNPNIIFDMAKRKLHSKCLVCTQKGNNVIVKSVDILPHQKAGPYVPPSSL
ncbi:M23 family metallopeptidase [uncultured Parabacteroides sp.]|uniref:M23 family metallopeptidase n=1 Tax=uncultured Parabacteroides sp. TaxID=512312 RepID=UPI00262C52A4|nr:M23 family metallopeptidase [uncultured Parabacteroides sp.]